MAQFLLDTHIFLWFIAGDQRLNPEIRQLITEPDNKILLSIVSIWEIAIKHSLGKLILMKPFDVLIPEQVEENEITIVPISLADLNEVVKLPLHHRDPFDRLLIAQAIQRSIPLISDDSNFSSYPVTLVV
jgi:PIN domain nuclease of toxin-antitoxin system